MPHPIAEYRGIVKTFAGITALDGVSLAIEAGECHALMGENGAGKSTLGKILAGIHRPDAGQLFVDGGAVQFHSPRDAARAGIGMVHQELAFAPDLSVAENLSMGHYPAIAGVLLNRPAMRRKAEQLLGRIGVTLNVRQPMRTLSTAQEQLVQIAAAVGTGARVLVFDEPTSSLSEPESQRLFELIESLRKDGVSIIYVSHRLPEVFRLSDRISVLRDGKLVGTLPREQATQDKLVEMMIGRPLAATKRRSIPRSLASAPPLLSVRNLTSPGKFVHVSFDVRAGEVVGMAGLVGAGRSEVAQAIFGLDPSANGSVLVEGEPLRLGSPSAAMNAGIGLVPEDRKRQGLVLDQGSRFNFSLPMLSRLARLGFMRRGYERDLAMAHFDRLRVKAASIDAPVRSLSGGNQQKVVFSKWVGRDCRVLIVDEPTRGVDVGTKAAMHELIVDIARRGAAVLLISSDLPEVLAVSDRILVMREGGLVSEISAADATQDRVLRFMAGVQEPMRRTID